MIKNQKTTYVRRVVEIFAKGRYSRPTEVCVARWLTDGDDSDAKGEALRELWDESLADPVDKAATDAAYAGWLTRMAVSHSREAGCRRAPSRYLRLWQGVAACLLVAVGVLGAMLMSRQPDRAPMLQVYCAAGETRELVLPDGTAVVLNGATSIVYPERFDGGCREVLLIGEAAFKVAKDADHPFVVKSEDMNVTALGTEFNLKAYPSHEEVRSTLLEGKVKVCYGGDKGGFILQPSEQLTYNRLTGTASVTHPVIRDVTAWQRGEIVFCNAPLPDIIQELETRFGYEFVYNASRLPADRYTFRFRRGMTLEEVMGIVGDVAGNLSVCIDGGKCKIRQGRNV